MRVDIEIRRPGWMTQLAEQASRYVASVNDLRSIQRPQVRLGTAVRLLLSEPIKSSAEYDAAVAVLSRNERELRRYLMGTLAIPSMGMHEDCVGALMSGDAESAALSSASLLHNAAQQFLVGAGDVYQGVKWIPDRLRRSVGPPAPLEDLLGVLVGTGVSDPTRLTVLRIRLAQVFATAAMTLGWEEAAADRWLLWDIQSDNGLRPALGCLPMRTNDAVVLAVVPQRQFKLSERALAVWAMCQGGTAEEIAEHAVGALAGTRFDTNEDTVVKIVTKFVEMGIVCEAAAS